MTRHQARRSSAAGLSPIEFAVVLAIVVVLAAVMTPAITKHVSYSRTVRANDDVKSIAGSLSSFFQDSGRWPTDSDTDKSPDDQEVSLLVSSAGALPSDGTGVTFAALTPSDTFENQLLDNTPGGSATNAYGTSGELEWRGPYLNEYESDPWGRKYLCNVVNFRPGVTDPVWVLSAGPDGVVDTATDSRTPGGDDIGFLLRR